MPSAADRIGRYRHGCACPSGDRPLLCLEVRGRRGASGASAGTAAQKRTPAAQVALLQHLRTSGRVIGRLASRLVAAVVFLIASLSVACSGDSEPQTTGSEGTVTTTAAPRSESVTLTPAAGNGPDVQVYPAEKCELWPGWSVSGGDVVNLLLPMHNVGNAVLDSLVSVRAEGSSGLAGSAFWDGKASGTVPIRSERTGVTYRAFARSPESPCRPSRLRTSRTSRTPCRSSRRRASVASCPA